MALSKKYKMLLFKAKMNPIFLHRARKEIKYASDYELVLLHSLIGQALITRGIYEPDKDN